MKSIKNEVVFLREILRIENPHSSVEKILQRWESRTKQREEVCSIESHWSIERIGRNRYLSLEEKFEKIVFQFFSLLLSFAL
jgi:hypothetical protein